MTVVAGVFDPSTRTAVLAADSQTTIGALRQRSPAKIVRLGGALVGLSGSPIYLNPIRQHPPLDADGDALAWTEALAARVWAWAREEGHGDRNDCGVRTQDLNLLVGTSAGLFYVTSDGDAAHIQEGVWAIGQGGEVALGAMLALRSTVQALASIPRVLATEGCRAACAVVITCGEPIQVEEVSAA